MDFNSDDKIKEVLGKLELPFNAAHWEEMSTRLDAEDLSGDTEDYTEFDQEIASSLGTLEESNPADWNAFADKLDRAENEDTFDDVIAAGLVGAGLAAGADWAAFSEKLDASEAGDLTTDDNIIDRRARGLENLESSYSEENWQLMRERIQEEFSLRRKLIRYKVAETALMVLAIFTLFNYLPKTEEGKIKLFEEVKQRIVQHKQQPIAETQLPVEAAKAQQSTSKSSDQNSTKAEGEIPNDQDASESELLITNYVATGNTVNFSVPAPIKRFEPIEGVKPTLKKSEYTPELEPTEVIKEEENSGWFNILKRKDSAAEKEEETAEVKDELMKSFVLAALNRNETKELVVDNEEKKLEPARVQSEHKNVRLGMFTAASLYGVYSPYDRFFNYRPEVTYDADAGGGILFDFQKNRFHIVTGGAYTPKYYRPSLGAEVVGSFETAYVREDLKEIQLDILHVPVEFRYDFLQRPKWRLYGATGLSFNFVLNSTFVIDSQILARNEAADYQDIRNAQEASSNLARKDFEQGVVEGGSIFENTFLTVQLGFGAERFVTQRWSVFFESIYQSQFSRVGIGPNDDSFRSLSLRLGVKATMFGK